MTPTDDAHRHREYLTALLAIDTPKEDALAMTIAYIQAEAMREIPNEPAVRPGPKPVR